MMKNITLVFLIICIAIAAYFIIGSKEPESHIVEESSNHQTSPDIDMFIGYWKDTASRQMFGSLEVWDLLTKCYDNPLQPKKKGAVLTDLNSLSYAILKNNTSTTPTMLKERQHIFYIVSGTGTITSGDTTADLHAGIGVIMPPYVEFTMANTGIEQLTMYIIEEPAPDGVNTNKEMVVKNENDNPVSTNIHRVGVKDWLFSINDGLTTLISMNPVTYVPKSLTPPHVHLKGEEEVWFAIDSDIFIQLGNQRRKFPIGSAYKVPSNGATPHSNINVTNVPQKLMWMRKYPVRRVLSPKKNKPPDNMI